MKVFLFDPLPIAYEGRSTSKRESLIESVFPCNDNQLEL